MTVLFIARNIGSPYPDDYIMGRITEDEANGYSAMFHWMASVRAVPLLSVTINAHTAELAGMFYSIGSEALRSVLLGLDGPLDSPLLGYRIITPNVWAVLLETNPRQITPQIAIFDHQDRFTLGFGYNGTLENLPRTLLQLAAGQSYPIVVMENNDWRSYPYTKDLRRVSAEDVAFLSATGTQRARYLLLRADSVALVPFDIPPYPEVP